MKKRYKVVYFRGDMSVTSYFHHYHCAKEFAHNMDGIILHVK